MIRTLEDLSMKNGRIIVPIPRVTLDIGFPDTCQKFSFKDSSIHARAEVVAKVFKHNSPIRIGGIWELKVPHSVGAFYLTLLADQMIGININAENLIERKFFRHYTWDMMVVGFSRDPMDWFPKPRWEMAGRDDILADLAEFLKNDLGDFRSAEFDSEGGFRV